MRSTVAGQTVRGERAAVIEGTGREYRGHSGGPSPAAGGAGGKDTQGSLYPLHTYVCKFL